MVIKGPILGNLHYNIVSFKFLSKQRCIVLYFLLNSLDNNQNETKFTKITITINPLLYQGQLVQGDISGQGFFYQTNGDSYKGEFRNDTYNGHGVYYFSNSTYMGNFVNGEISGLGIMVFDNGTNTNICMFDRGVQNGYGIFTESEGYVLEGVFRDATLNGQGILTSPTGDIMVGEYTAGEQTGWHILTQKDGLQFRIKYSAGVEEDREAIAV